MRTWQLQEAKARLSELVKLATAEGPQDITVHGRPVAVVMSRAEYEKLRGQRLSFVEFIRRSPLAGTRLENRRNRSTTRKVSI